MSEDPLSPTPEENAAPAPEQPATAAPEASASGEGEKIATLEAEIARLKDHLLRTLADAENTRKRATKDREDAGKYAITSFARDLLDFAGNFHRALEALPADLKSLDERIAGVMTGISAMEKDLLKTLEKHGITKVDPLDHPFDANFHEVMFEVAGTGKPAGMVVQVIEPGYVIKDRLLRPAKVGIAKAEAGSPGTLNPGSQIDKAV